MEHGFLLICPSVLDVILFCDRIVEVIDHVIACPHEAGVNSETEQLVADCDGSKVLKSDITKIFAHYETKVNEGPNQGQCLESCQDCEQPHRRRIHRVLFMHLVKSAPADVVPYDAAIEQDSERTFECYIDHILNDNLWYIAHKLDKNGTLFVFSKLRLKNSPFIEGTHQKVGYSGQDYKSGQCEAKAALSP